MPVNRMILGAPLPWAGLGITTLLSVLALDGGVVGCEQGPYLTDDGTACGTCVSNSGGLIIDTAINGVQQIGRRALRNCGAVQTVNLPASVNGAIGSEAFSGCTNLRTVELYTTIQTIGASAFLDCTALTSITFLSPQTTTPSPTFSIGNFALCCSEHRHSCWVDGQLAACQHVYSWPVGIRAVHFAQINGYSKPNDNNPNFGLC